MKKRKEIVLRKRNPERGDEITIETENDQVIGIRRDLRQNKDFPIRMGWNMTNPKVDHDLRKWMGDNGYYVQSSRTTETIITPYEFATGRIPPNGRFKIR